MVQKHAGASPGKQRMIHNIRNRQLLARRKNQKQKKTAERTHMKMTASMLVPRAAAFAATLALLSCVPAALGAVCGRSCADNPSNCDRSAWTEGINQVGRTSKCRYFPELKGDCKSYSFYGVGASCTCPGSQKASKLLTTFKEKIFNYQNVTMYYCCNDRPNNDAGCTATTVTTNTIATTTIATTVATTTIATTTASGAY